MGVTQSGVHCSGLEGVMRRGCVYCYERAPYPSAPSYTLHRFPEKQPRVFLGMCEQPFFLLPSLSLPLSWLSSLKRCPNINICQENGKEEISLSPSPHHSSHFSLSINCLFRATPYLNCPSIYPLPPSTDISSLSLPEFLPSLFTSLTPLSLPFVSDF